MDKAMQGKDATKKDERQRNKKGERSGGKYGLLYGKKLWLELVKFGN